MLQLADHRASTEAAPQTRQSTCNGRGIDQKVGMSTTASYLRRSPSLPMPATWGEIRLVAALARYPAARHLAKRMGLAPDDLSSDLSQQLVRELLDDLPISTWVADGLHHYSDDCPCSWKGCVAICNGLDNGTATKASALAAVAEFISEVSAKRLAESFKWAAERVARGEFSPKDRDELDRLQEAAGVLRWGVV